MKMSPSRLTAIRRRLLSWYRTNRRALPWRKSRDPYGIWVAEIMLQQTRIAAVIPYYERFLRRFPNVQSLVRARITEVLKYWAGLGYYSRARNLHAAAREIARKYNGEFPKSLDRALALPGIGRYTAAAVLSIAYKVPAAALDGNVVRVLARLFAFRGEPSDAAQRRKLTDTAEHLLPPDAPGDWNQAMMELGETVCTPRAPSCHTCPLSHLCRANALGLAEKIPTPRKKPATVLMRIAAAILLDPNGHTLLTKIPGRHDAVLFSGMWQFPAAEVTEDANPADTLARHLRATLGIASTNLVALPRVKHAVTFRKLTLLPFLFRVGKLRRPGDSRIVAITEFASLPVSSATRKIARAAIEFQTK